MRRPDSKCDTFCAAYFGDVRAEFVIDLLVAPFAKEMEINFAQRWRKLCSVFGLRCHLCRGGPSVATPAWNLARGGHGGPPLQSRSSAQKDVGSVAFFRVVTFCLRHQLQKTLQRRFEAQLILQINDTRRIT